MSADSRTALALASPRIEVPPTEPAYTVERVADDLVEDVLAALTPHVENFYAHTYGTAAAAGIASPEMFQTPRGGLMAMWTAQTPPGENGEAEGPRLVGMAGWTDTDHLGYTPAGQPGPPAPSLEGWVPGERVAELRRLFLVEEVRGQGLSTVLDAARLEAIADDGQFTWAVGETGHAQERSRALHSRWPYREIPPFGAFAHEADLGSHYYGVRPADLRTGAWG